MKVFSVNQLVAVAGKAVYDSVQAGKPLSQEEIDANKYGYMGRVSSIDGDNVTVASPDGDLFTIPSDKLLQLVHYDIRKHFSGNVGSRAMITAVDHPNPNIPANWKVHTSEVVYVTRNGFFETLNTLYVPNATDLMGVGIYFKSPYLCKDMNKMEVLEPIEA